MEVYIEEIIIYGLVGVLCLALILWYLKKLKKRDVVVEAKINKAKEEGIHEPISLYPLINYDLCIGSGACVTACPEKDILGLANGRAKLVNASECIGHGACFHACPVEAISLVFGTEKRGVDLPHINQNYETNVHGIFIAGELGGMGLIRNCVEQGMMAVDEIFKTGIPSDHGMEYDLLIIGAGPAGVSASLTAKKHGINFLTVDQDTLGGSINSFPRAKVVMTQPMDLPLYGKVKLFETSKDELLHIWEEALSKNGISIQEKFKVEKINRLERGFEVISNSGQTVTTRIVLLTIGRRGTPRKLGAKGEANSQKVFYRLLEPELIKQKNILVVGAGDSALESAMMLMDQNTVYHSYRGDQFKRAKPKNKSKMTAAIASGKINMLWNTNVTEILEDKVVLVNNLTQERIELPNDFVYVFIGGELPNKFLQNIGVEVQKRFKYTVKSHK